MFINSSRIQRQFEYLEKLGIDILPLYKQTGIARDCKFESDLNFDFEQYKTVLDFALRQTNNPEYGLDFGTQPFLGGTVGSMGASCRNLKESLVQGCKFFRLLGDFADIAFIDDENSPKIVYTPVKSWVLQNPNTAKVEVDIMFSFLNTILRVNSNDVLKPRKVNFAFKKPVNTEKYNSIFRLEPDFDAEYNEMIFDNATMMMPMKAFNQETLQLLNQHLESQLAQLSRSEKTSDKVKKVLHSSFQYQFPDIDSVAEKLNISPRTLQRKLSEEKTNFKLILQETRFGIAKQLLQKNELTVSEISYMLGYSDIGNFSRSFKKYAGMSPQEYRKQF